MLLARRLPLRSLTLFGLISTCCIAGGQDLDPPTVDQESLRAQLENYLEVSGDEANSPALQGIASEPEMIETDGGTLRDQLNAAANQLPANPAVAADVAAQQTNTPQADDRDAPRLNSLALSDVVASVYQSFPAIVQARQQAQVANGELTQAWGDFDTKLKLETLNEPTGFYENYRHSFGASRQTWTGGQVYGGYRIGRGSFQPWYKERETDDGGEFKFGYRQSLLQGRAIDPSRVAVYQATLDRRAVQPLVLETVLFVSQDAALQYWKWVEAGLMFEAQRSLLDLATTRANQLEDLIEAGKNPEIDRVFNRQLIAERRAKLIESQQKFLENSVKLSLFLRDQQGAPLLPEDSLLPNGFPPVEEMPQVDLQVELTNALARRPKLQSIRLKRQRLEYDQALACNHILPQLDFIGEASQDMGADASSSDDKDQFLLILGLQGELPIQRRKARGKLISIRGKLAQLAQEQRFLQNKIQAELRIGFNELQRDAEVVEQALIAVNTARESLGLYQAAFEIGKFSLINLNLLEVKANEAEIKYISAQQQWHAALVRLQTSMGLDPLEQTELLDR